ncbi:MAG: IS3 family transposase [Candidatus Riflebacteria bacterium]|nr:IS3 family transposase [Candidatus Riflebacteria bacterium]
MRTIYRTRQELNADVFEYINMFYNCYRGIHLGYKPPMKFASIKKLKMAD